MPRGTVGCIEQAPWWLPTAGVLIGGILTLLGGYVGRTSEARHKRADAKAEILGRIYYHHVESQEAEDRTPEQAERLRRESQERAFDASLNLTDRTRRAYLDLVDDRITDRRWLTLASREVWSARSGGLRWLIFRLTGWTWTS